MSSCLHLLSARITGRYTTPGSLYVILSKVSFISSVKNQALLHISLPFYKKDTSKRKQTFQQSFGKLAVSEQ
jgi:hypothetical protein